MFNSTSKIRRVREDVEGYISNEKVSCLFFHGTKELKIFRILKTDYPKFHNAYSLQVKSGHDRKVIIPILNKWAKFKLVKTIENTKNSKHWRLSEKILEEKKIS